MDPRARSHLRVDSIASKGWLDLLSLAYATVNHAGGDRRERIEVSLSSLPMERSFPCCFGTMSWWQGDPALVSWQYSGEYVFSPSESSTTVYLIARAGVGLGFNRSTDFTITKSEVFATFNIASP